MSTWHTGLCACMVDTSQCIDNVICCPCAISRQLVAVDKAEPDTCSVKSAICPGLLPCAGCIVRRKIVKRFNIEESLMASLFYGCLPCSHCQHHRELAKNNRWPGTSSCIEVRPDTYDRA